MIGGIEPVRFSRLKLIGTSPLHFISASEDSDSSRDKGTSVHSVLLGGRRVTYYAEKTESGRSAPRNGGKWEAFKAANPDAIILSASEYDCTMRMVDAVRANSLAMELLKGACEDTQLFNHCGLLFRTTPDVWTPTRAVELKTCRSAKPSRFAYQAASLEYHAQMALHEIGLSAGGRLSTSTPEHWVVAVENGNVPAVTVFKYKLNAIEKGMRLIRSWTEQLKVCLESGQWPAYAQNVVDLDIPEDGELIFPEGAEPNSADNLPAGW